MTTNQNEWVFKKEINITHIFATITLVVSALIFGSDMDKRIDLNATNIQHLSKSQAKNEQRYKEFRSEMRADIKAINNKLDRLLESRSKGR